MNRIILIGNGFDLAHGLKTGYKDFIDSYWSEVKLKIEHYLYTLDQYGKIMSPPEDNFISFEKFDKNALNLDMIVPSCESSSPYSELRDFLNKVNNGDNQPIKGYLKFKNKFFKSISNQCSLLNWVDIENEYYGALKKLLKTENAQARNHSVKKLNEEFNAVKELLEKYLREVSQSEVEAKESISNAFKAQKSILMI